MSFGGGKDNAYNPQNPNNALTIGGSTGGGETSSVTNPDFIWGPQAGYLQQLYGMGSNLANNFGQYQQAGQDVFNSAMGGFNQMMNPGINPQLEAYQGEVQRNLERNLLPSIRSSAGGFGQMGSSREGIASGLAVADSNQQIADMSSKLYNDDMNRMLGAMGMSGQLANLGMGLPWYALNQYAGLLGDPTALGGGGSSQGSQFDESWSYGRDIGGGGGGGGGGWNGKVGLW